MFTAVKPKHRPRPEQVAHIRLHVDQLIAACGTHRPHQCRVRNDDAWTEERNIDLKDAPMLFDPFPHRLAAEYSKSSALHEFR
jgi:hypothetical protein